MLINCVAYENGTKLADLSVEQISDYLMRPGCFVWVALRDSSDDELVAMQREFGLHDLAVEDARHGHQRPKIEEYGDMIFAVIHTVEFSPTDELQVGEVSIFVGPNFVLSVRNRSHQGFLGVRARAEREPHLLRHGSAFVFYALMDAVGDTIGTAIQVNLSMVTIEESEVTKRLAAWAGLFAVATAFAGIWGMNFKSMPELQWEYGYPVALAVIAGTCAELYRRFKRAGWL